MARVCSGQGRSIAQARTRVREALGLFVDGAETAELVDDIRVGAGMLNAILKARRARQAADRHQKLATLASRAAAKKLVAKMSVRDAGEVLGALADRNVDEYGKFSSPSIQ